MRSLSLCPHLLAVSIPARVSTLALPLALTLTLAFALTGCLATEPRSVRVEERALGVLALDAVDVSVGAGDLEIVGDDATEMIAATVTLRTNLVDPAASDDDALRALDVVLEERDGRAFLSVRLDGAPAGYWADVRVVLPARLRVDCDDDSGDASFAHLAELSLRDESGDIVVDDVAGEVTIDDDSGDIDVRSTASLHITDTSGDIQIRGVRGAVGVTDDSGEIEASAIDGDVDVTDGSGGIVVRDVGGVVRIRDGSGDILVENVGGFELLEDGSGEVTER